MKRLSEMKSVTDNTTVTDSTSVMSPQNASKYPSFQNRSPLKARLQLNGTESTFSPMHALSPHVGGKKESKIKSEQ